MTSQGSEPGYRRWLAQAYADYRETEVLPEDISDAPDGCGEMGPPAEADLAQTRQAWSARYEVLRVTAAEQRDFALLASGSVVRRPGDGEVRGIDGALYSPARYLLGTFGAYRPVAIVTTPAWTVEIVQAFRSSDERDAWLANRTRVTPERLSGGQLSEVSRTAREERVLGWLLRHGAGGVAEVSGLRTEMFRTYSRSEIFLAWRAAAAESAAAGTAGPDRGLITRKLAEQLRLVPAWAGSYVGWPVGQLAIAYLRRLMATNGAVELVREAAWQLADEDSAARTVTTRSHVNMPAARPRWAREPRPPRLVMCTSLDGRDRRERAKARCQASNSDKADRLPLAPPPMAGRDSTAPRRRAQRGARPHGTL